MNVSPSSDTGQVVLRISVFNQSSEHHPIKSEFELLAEKLHLHDIAEIIIKECSTQGELFGEACQPAKIFFGGNSQPLTKKIEDLNFKINFPYIIRHSIRKPGSVPCGNVKFDTVIDELCCDHHFVFSDMYLDTSRIRMKQEASQYRPLIKQTF